MSNNDVFSKRWLKNGLLGDAFLDDVAAQRDLAFAWNGETIVDSATGLEYFYPSTIGNALFYHGSFERAEVVASSAAVAGIERSVIFDIGANIGVHAVGWTTRLPNAMVHAFEPVPKNIAVLRRNIDRAGSASRVVIIEAAAADRSGSLELSQCEDAAYSTIGDPAMSVESRYSVQAFSLDDYVQQHSIAKVDLIKIDVEGEELRVLEGAKGILDRDTPFLLIEIGERSAREGKSMKQLAKLGYTAYAVCDGVILQASPGAARVSNHFLVPEVSSFVPSTEPTIAFAEADYREMISLRQLQRLVELQSDMEQLRTQVQQTTESLAAEQRRAQLMQTQLALAVPHVADEEIADRLRGYIDDLRVEVDRQHTAAIERLALIEDMEQRMRGLGDQLRAGNEAREELQAAAQERLEVIERQQAGLVARDADIAAKAALIDRYEALLAGRNDGEAQLREELQRVRAQLAEVEVLATERLDVIRALKSERLPSGPSV